MNTRNSLFVGLIATIVGSCCLTPTSGADAPKSKLLSLIAKPSSPADVVTGTPGCVAFWDFVKREPDESRRFVAHVPDGVANDYPLDAWNWVKDYWERGRAATYADFPQLGRGPFGNAIRIVKETDEYFRPLLVVPRERLHNSPLDIKGQDKSVSVIVWAIRESGNHALAGIWHEGTNLNNPEALDIQKVQRGQRQYGLFAGLNKEGSACGHISENGAGSFLNRFALNKCNSAGVAPCVPADSPIEILDKSWQCFAMTYDHRSHELTGWLNGASGDTWFENPKAHERHFSFVYQAYMQAHFAHTPGTQPGEDPTFPSDQYYLPPEERVVSTKILQACDTERVELREYRYTKVEVFLRRGDDGQFTETGRELVGLRLNPWWYPHSGIFVPDEDGSGGPFTIGRVICSSRMVGFTGWIGGVAVYDRALHPEELANLADLRSSVVVEGVMGNGSGKRCFNPHPGSPSGVPADRIGFEVPSGEWSFEVGY